VPFDMKRTAAAKIFGTTKRVTKRVTGKAGIGS
jgi:hypothetical protein